MAFRKIDAPSIKELFLSQMEEMILSGELKPGDKLPPERELADTMGISKTVVHEGIRELSRRDCHPLEGDSPVSVCFSCAKRTSEKYSARYGRWRHER